MMADVDAASIITAMQTGATFKYEFIVFLILLILPLYFIQEVAGRVGSVTRKGLGQLIRENFSRNISILLSFPMAATDLLSYVAEYAGIAIGMSILGIPPIITIPVVFAIHVLIVCNKKYASAEKILLAVSLVMLISYLILMLRGVANYQLLPGSINSNFLFLIAANVGAVIMPFMLFYQTTATAQKDFHSVHATKLETIVGAVASQLIMIAIVIASAGLGSGSSFSNSPNIGRAIIGIGGRYAPIIFSVGLVAAGFLALVVVSLSSAWSITESLNIKRDDWFKIYVLESIPAVIVPLVYPNLLSLTLNLMVALVFVLIGPVIALGILAQDKRLMGEHSLSAFDKIAFWSSVLIVILCGLLAFI